MYDTEVAIVGAGPTGLALACELRLAGVSCRILEKRAEEPNLTRAFAVHARTLELLDARGLADRLVPLGIQVPQVQPAPGATLKLTSLPTRYPMVLIVPQTGTERLLEERAAELGVTVERGVAVTGLSQTHDSVTLELGNGETLRSAYVVGTDGAHSTVRDLIGVPFAGKQYQTHIILADVTLSRPPEQTLFGVSTHEGLALFVPFGPSEDGSSWFRAIVWDRSREDVPLSEPVTLAELRESFKRITGDDYGMGEPRWRTRFLSERRQAEKYRVGRVFLAGDAAHVHSPVGGQGMNTGIQDAVNLGWKLAAALRGRDFLDSYQAERHPVGQSVLQLTDALNQLVLSGSRLGVHMRRLVIRLALGLPPVRRLIGMRLSGLGIRYERPEGADELVGRRMPDVDLGGRRLYEALRGGEFVLVKDFGGKAVLVRPDGYVAWAAKAADQRQIDAAVKHWCDAAVQ